MRTCDKHPEWTDHVAYRVRGCPYCKAEKFESDNAALRTLLSHVRAVQQPRLTEEQREAVRGILGFIHTKECETDGTVRLTLGALLPFISKLRAAFPGVFGKEG